MIVSLVVLSLLRLAASPVNVCPIAPPTANAPAWFEFQVDRPARFTTATSSGPRPDTTLAEPPPHSADFALVQFIVDTAGIPQPQSMKILVRPSALRVDAVAAALPGWRYRPAMARGCTVPQLVQTPLRWK